MFDVNKPEQGAILFLWSGCVQYPGESAAGFGFCEKDLGRNASGTLSKTESKTQKRVLKCGKETRSLKEVAGNCNRALPRAPCLTVQGVAGNSNERLKSNYKRPGWTTFTCKSQIMCTLRKSFRIFVEN